MRIYGHYIWDFDGTLFDSYPHSAQALYATARHYGVEVGRDAIEHAMRHSFAEAFKLVGLNEEQLKMFHRLRGDDAFEPPIVPFPHATAALDTLRQLGGKHYLYTHSNHKMSVRFIENFGMERYFEGWVTPDDPGFTPKPDPGALRWILDHWHIDPADAAMVGDRAIDMRCAASVGIDGILIDPDGLAPEVPAKYRVDDLIELIHPD